MARIDLITERDQLSSETQRDVFDRIVASRGTMIRPYQVLMHAPAVVSAISDVGAAIRFGGSLDDRDRELVIITTAQITGCQFEWDSHHPIAIEVGVRPETTDFIREGGGGDTEVPDTRELAIIEYVRELSSDNTVSEVRFSQMVEMLGTEGTVELTVIVGYYTMLAYVMSAAGAC